jgi:BirA family biotin operon repressor/biotin-[acetyl-CoA-carboxylase] ligase
LKQTTKAKVLQYLENNRGLSISGEKIADSIGVSRNAVWKAVAQLKKDGYRIKAVNNRGYCLCNIQRDIITAAQIAHFSNNTDISRIKVYDTVESTNTAAKELAIAGAAHGTLIVSDCQTGGKGRYGREFISPRGSGIYMSMILRPSSGNNPTLVTSYAAVAVCESIETLTAKSPKIKWVNDIFIDGKKVCGILNEAVTDFESGQVEWIVVGIGINFTACNNLPSHAGAIFEEDSPTTSRNNLIAEIAARMLNFDGKCDIAAYRNRMMWLGERITVTGRGTAFDAQAVDVDDNGRLIVKKDNGQTETVCSGEVSIKSIKKGTD